MFSTLTNTVLARERGLVSIVKFFGRVEFHYLNTSSSNILTGRREKKGGGKGWWGWCRSGGWRRRQPAEPRRRRRTDDDETTGRLSRADETCVEWETEREKETAGRRFQRPAGANLDANRGTSPTPSPPLADPRHHDEDDDDDGHDDHDDDVDDDHDDVDQCKNTSSSVGIVASSRRGWDGVRRSPSRRAPFPYYPSQPPPFASPFAHRRTCLLWYCQLNFPIPGYVNSVMFCSGIIMNLWIYVASGASASLLSLTGVPFARPPL